MSGWAGAKNGTSMLLNTGQFNREVARERMRATRRCIPFCVITIELIGKTNHRRRKNAMTRVLHRHLRITDHKAFLGGGKFGVLLVDTPEMGGRSVVDRLSGVFQQQKLNAQLELKVHDPEGFDSNDFHGGGGNRRYGDDPNSRWVRVDDPNVEVASEEPLVSRPAYSRITKRSLDIAGATFGLVVGSPLILGSMLAVKLTSPGPALFVQTREGHRGKPFKIYKLRTMVVDAEAKQAALRSESHRDGPAFKVHKDPRVTRVGNLLRKTCIDELPQLWNVLKGDMSLVGPRPLPWHESRACDSWHRRRLDIKPGMTCHWQVNKTKADTFDEWMRMDLRYVDRVGLFRDLRLIAKTLIVPLTGRGSD